MAAEVSELPEEIVMEAPEELAAVDMESTERAETLPTLTELVAAEAMVRAVLAVKPEESQQVAAEEQETLITAALAALALLLFTILSTRPHNRKETTP